MNDEAIRNRTEVVLACIMGLKPDTDAYIASLEGEAIGKQDVAALTMAAPSAPYTMKDLGAPIAPSSMVIPEDYNSYLAGHTKVSSSYDRDWPVADNKNRFGEHHPFGASSNCCPLMHGAAYGEPDYVDHVLRFIKEGTEGEDSPALKHRDMERRIRSELQGLESLVGSPNTSQYDLFKRDLNRNGGDHDEYVEMKREDLQTNYGLLSYLFGLEWNDTDERESFMDLLGELSTTDDMDAPQGRKIRNDFQTKAGIGWDRALRNWRDRFTPIAAWWQRPSDRHGPVTPPSSDDPLRFFHSPWMKEEENITEGLNYHWWEPFQFWGGVSRAEDSLHSFFSQSYPSIFEEGWLSDLLFTGITVDGPSSLGGSHFPSAANDPNSEGMEHILSSIATGNHDFERRRSNWSATSHQAHLHPSEVGGQGGLMTIPSQVFAHSNLGTQIMSVAEAGRPRTGPLREPHPNSNSKYHEIHATHAIQSDAARQELMHQMAMNVMGEFGPEVLAPVNGSIDQNTIARGNMQQVAAAADHLLLRGQGVSDRGHSVPDVSRGRLLSRNGRLGPVHPQSDAVVPPVYLGGNTDAWGHEMPADLGWKYDHESDSIAFDKKEQPFSILQRTVHENHLGMIDPSFSRNQIYAKNRDIHALTPNDFGYTSLGTDLHKSEDEHEPTGVFGTLIEPAHVVYDLDDFSTLKGFSGDWIVQKKPEGKRELIEKKGSHIKPTNLPGNVKDDLRKIKGDVSFDGYLDDKVLNVVDLLVHKGNDMHMEPLSDRVDALRTLYESTENIHYPSPSNCVTADTEGLSKTVANMDKGDLFVRDATSTFIKEKETHPFWVLLGSDEIAKQIPYPPLPEVSVRGYEAMLEYPSILNPVIVKLGEEDENGGFPVESYKGMDYLVKHAKTQVGLWGPVAAFLLKEGEGGGDGGLTSATPGTYQAIHSDPGGRKRKRRTSRILRAPEVTEADEDDTVSELMHDARKEITNDDTPKTTEQLCSAIAGLKKDHLLRFGGEYGLEETEDGKWTVNEAIDDDIPDGVIAKFVFPRMNSASPDGGAWSGMQADITAPRGPTELTDELGTTFADPSLRGREEMPDKPIPFKPLQIRVEDDGEEAILDIEEDRAILRFPRREKKDEKKEIEAQPVERTDKAP